MNYERMYKELREKIFGLGMDDEVKGYDLIILVSDMEDTEKARQEVEEGQEPEQQAEPKKRVSHLELARQTRKIK